MAQTGSAQQDPPQAEVKLPYSMTAEFGQNKFGELYEKALLRKRLFKEYIIRNKVLERLNLAIEAMYDCEVLPEDPIDWLVAFLKAPAPAGAAPRAGVQLRSSPAFTLSSGGVSPALPNSPARRLSPEHARQG